MVYNNLIASDIAQSFAIRTVSIRLPIFLTINVFIYDTIDIGVDSDNYVMH